MGQLHLWRMLLLLLATQNRTEHKTVKRKVPLMLHSLAARATVGPFFCLLCVWDRMHYSRRRTPAPCRCCTR
uniref:Secreted protein n=1 Tax=Anopheles darlingi TaxID=43151 RepID=A0A2M4DME6_ANODA